MAKKHGKKYVDALKLIDETKLYSPKEAVELVNLRKAQKRKKQKLPARIMLAEMIWWQKFRAAGLTLKSA